MRLCAYCEKDNKLTKEHVLPSFIYRYQGKASGWREKQQKIISSEATFKDVCEKCNNVVLSRLDAHAKEVLSTAGVFTDNFKKKTLILTYDYELLSKWLLKTAFNSSRVSAIEQDTFRKFNKFILGESMARPEFIITAGLLKPFRLTKNEHNSYGEALKADKMRYANPFFARIS